MYKNFCCTPVHSFDNTVVGHGKQGVVLETDQFYAFIQSNNVARRIPKRLDTVGELNIGDHDFVLYDKLGHTDGDLVIFDRTTGVLFASDLVFAHRAPTTPHAEINGWLDTLAAIQSIGASVIVPGHGPVSGGKDAVESTAKYLRWLDSTLRRAATEGEDMAELINLEIPAQFPELHVVQEELQRSIAHLYPALEQSATPNTDLSSTETNLQQLQDRYAHIGPEGYRMDQFHAPTPPTVPNAVTISTAQLIELIDSRHPVLVDVVKANFRPARDGLPAAWLPTERRNIPGSIWLPNVGFGKISAQFDSYFRRELGKATNNRKNYPVVFYCRTHCWASWNAVQRAGRYGYETLYWYPFGADGWEYDGGELVEAIPVPVD